ncbi:hypothetical protein [Streptomyces sp. KN37]|uniref:hypothetical protein n=1 Tax=Streptomyces sp. KN37 TaxID=3090667 RepID=UPI002A74B0DD|nr:hypothetical protein [Streptomyces sp. KN37]WPO69929.1 hypothetical protein R9806_04430 [Streptomyces sp. KN37]
MSFLIASGHIEVEAKTDAAKSKITALVGAMGALGPAAGMAGAAVASAGAGLAAFGLAAGKQIADLKKASEAQTKYQDAVRQSGKSSQEAIKAELAYQQTLSKMPRSTREATAAFSALKDSYSDWSDSLADDTMPVFTKSFQLFSALLPKTSGLVKGTSAELDRRDASRATRTPRRSTTWACPTRSGPWSRRSTPTCRTSRRRSPARQKPPSSRR